MQTNSRISYLMELLGISGKELAMEIGTDTTTVSKWRNGQRKLKYRSKYTRKIVTYFLSDTFLLHREKLFSLLKNYNIDISNRAENEIIEMLCVWMTEEVEDSFIQLEAKCKEDTIVPVEVYSGNEGWFAGAKSFWDYVIELPPGQTVYIGDFGDVQWDALGQTAVREMVSSIYRCVKRGHKVIIIDKMTDEYKPYVVILRWLPIYLQKGVEIKYFQKDMKEFYKKSVYAVENHIALVGMSLEKEKADNLTMVHRDEISVSFYYKMIASIANNSKQLIFTSKLSNTMKMVEIMKENFNPMKLTYMIHHMPTFHNMPVSLLEEILKDNEVSEQQMELCLLVNEKRREIRNQCNYIQIYDLDALEEAIQKDYIVDYELSKVLGKEARIKKDQFREHLKYLAKITTTSTYTMVLTSFKELNLNVDNTSIIVQDDSIVIAWNAQLHDRRMYCKELTVVGGYFNYLREIWNRIPAISKNDNWTTKQLNRMLEFE